MSLAGAKLAAAEQAELSHSEAKSDTSATAGGAVTSAPPTSCGVAPSGASDSRLPEPVKKASLTWSTEDSDEPAEPAAEEEQRQRAVDYKPVSKERWCRVEGMPRQSWLRRRRKHWPDQSKSTVFSDMRCLNIEYEARCDWKVLNKLHDERRHHFPGRRTDYDHLSVYNIAKRRDVL